jgi:hypothetical protein
LKILADSASTLIGHSPYLDDSESIISENISHLPSSHVNTIPHQLGAPPSLPAPECFVMPGQAHYFTVGSSVSAANDPNYYVIEKPMSMMSAVGTLPHLQKASSKSSTTSKSCSSTESQKYMIKNLIQQTNHSKFKFF